MQRGGRRLRRHTLTHTHTFGGRYGRDAGVCRAVLLVDAACGGMRGSGGGGGRWGWFCGVGVAAGVAVHLFVLGVVVCIVIFF